MNVIDYCKGMEMELIAWKAKMYDLTRKIETLGSKEREKVLPNIQDLNMLITEMSSRIEQLKNECPTEWNPQKKDIDEGSVDMRGKYEQQYRFRYEFYELHLRTGVENFSELMNRLSDTQIGDRRMSAAVFSFYAKVQLEMHWLYRFSHSLRLRPSPSHAWTTNLQFLEQSSSFFFSSFIVFSPVN